MNVGTLEKFASVILDHSLKIKRDEILIIDSSYLAEPFLLEVYKGALLRGAHPVLKVSLPGASYYHYRYAEVHQLEFVPPWSKEEIANASCLLDVIATKNARSLANVDPEKMRISNVATKEIQEFFDERYNEGKLRWCITLYPTDSEAQEANMSIFEFEEFVMSACHLDEDDPVEYWRQVEKKQEKIAKFLESKREISIKGEGTDLKVKVSGRKWINASGTCNFPDGEVFTSPIEDGVQGTITFNMPQYYMGKEAEGVSLEFKDGKICKVRADKGQDFLERILESDEGAKRPGEFAFGTNYGIKNLTRNILFDEKIGGTIHIALGRGFPEAGGVNKSVVHWDMIYDMRQNGEIYADGELIYKKGEFLVEL